MPKQKNLPQEPHRLHAYLFLLITAIIWGIAGPIIKLTLGGIEPLLFLTYRFFLSSLLAIPLLFITKHEWPKSIGDFFLILLLSFLTSTVSLGFLFFGLKDTTVLEMSLMELIGPILIVVAGGIFLREHVTKTEKIGMLIALLGTSLTIIQPIFQDGLEIIKAGGNIMILLYLVVTAFSAVILKELLRKGYSPLGLTNISFIVGFITLAPFLYREMGNTKQIYQTLINTPFVFHLGVIFMAFISGTLAYTLNNLGQRTIEISEAALFSYLVPIFSAIIAVFLMGEKVTPVFIIGSIVVCAGVAIAEIKKRRYT